MPPAPISLSATWAIERLHEEPPDLGKARFSESAVRDLVAYHWPGNVRELKNVIERLYACDRDRTIQSSELPLEVTSTESIRGTFSQRVRAFETALLLNALKDAGETSGRRRRNWA